MGLKRRTFWMFAGWLNVSFGSVDTSLTARGKLLELPTFDENFPPCPCSSSGTEGSPSTINSESSSDFGSASGASDSNKILSEGTYKKKLTFPFYFQLEKKNKATGIVWFFFLSFSGQNWNYINLPPLAFSLLSLLLGT